MKTLYLFVLLMLVLVGCASQPSTAPVAEMPEVKTEELISQDSSKEKSMKPQGDVSIIITNGRLLPSEITLSHGVESTIVVDNQEDTSKRFEIPLYGSEVSVDIGAGQYEVIVVTPQSKGRVVMELNGASVGTVNIR